MGSDRKSNSSKLLWLSIVTCKNNEVRKSAKIRNWYNQEPNQTWEGSGSVVECLTRASPASVLNQQVTTRQQWTDARAWQTQDTTSLQCLSVLSDILVKIDLCIPLERGSNVLSTGNGFICLSLPCKLKIAAHLQKVNFVQCYSVLRDIHPMTGVDLCHVTEWVQCHTVISTKIHLLWRNW